MKERAPATEGFLRPVRVEQGNAAYPASLTRFLGEGAPRHLSVIGNAELLKNQMLALFCSIQCPGSIILKTYDLARAMRDMGIPVIGGFHTPMERECLDLLLRGTQPVVICPARVLERMRPPQEVREGIQSGRLLLISPFGSHHRRATAVLADERNRLVAALTGGAFVSYAASGGKTEALWREILGMGKPLFTVDSPENGNLLAFGAKPLPVELCLCSPGQMG